VTGILDRAEIDELILAIEAMPATEDPATRPIVLTTTTKRGTTRRHASAPEAAKLLAVSGRNITRDALPDRIAIRLDPGPADAPGARPWPFSRNDPATFVEAAAILPVDAGDRVTRRERLAALAPGAHVTFEGKTYRVAILDLLPP
jgi:hypothetical protein